MVANCEKSYAGQYGCDIAVRFRSHRRFENAAFVFFRKIQFLVTIPPTYLGREIPSHF
jgi:hypothetical protein